MTDEELRQIADVIREQGAAIEKSVERRNAESHRQYEVVAESIRHEVRLVAEGILTLKERIDRERSHTDDRLDRRFADTQALLRVERLESTPH